ncbi:MAG: hypothetical protein JW795_19805, partial [Chitinivibrionales bacterium]|nr:hypothetical protein [Chitinivibrionales bacterium]
MSINRETDASAINRNFNDLLEKGAEYSDIRVFPHDRRETFLLENGCLEVNDSQDYCGIGVRVLYQGAWGFAADSRSDQIDLCFQQAFRNAQAASQLISAPLCMKSTKPVQPLNGSYSSPVQTPYDSVSLKEKIELLHEIDAILTESWIRKRMIRLRCLQRDVLFCNTEGTRIERKLSHVFAVATGFALDKDDSMQRRSHTLSTTGKGTRGWELVLSPQHFRDKILILKDDLRQLCTAPELEPGPRSLILLPGQGFLQLHETIGHPLELDRILGYEL